MKFRSSSASLISFISFIFLPSLISSQACKKSCGNQLIRYPFGSGPGCGDPRFQQYVTCDQQNLILNTHSGCYTIDNIDYNNHVIYIQDPSMSTCSSTHPSQGFSLDWDAPFAFLEDNVFALLDCATASSPLYNSQSGLNNSIVPLCDNEGAPICSSLYSCPTISRLNLPISTCCVYTPIDLGPAFEMNLQRLQCTSYASFYSFNGRESNPGSWKYGIALKYRFNVKNDFPSACSDCENSHGVCGYTGSYNSFVCNCFDGLNTTTDCYFTASMNNNVRVLLWKFGTWMISSLACFLIWAL
ncbi:hypothetical protein IFM89_013366 [Coptis chinensis]|uniref:Wall-associated receptor kinase galacturonan-binding domain-containing protein n=1 Tax=Coptis chinensis TaxID=261450 RepID=A0A835LXY2_9MAGN|nr:hypothetical protein IFM89_013366 [Coptis chinensis]